MAVTTFVAHWQHLTQANASIREVQETLAEQEEKHREPVDPLVAEAVNEIAEVAEVMTAQTKRAMAQEAATASRSAHDTGLYDDVAERTALPDVLPLTEEAWKTDAQRQLDRLVTAVDKLKAFEAEHPREIAAVKTMLHVAHQMMNDLTLWVGRTLGMSEASLAEVAEGQRNVEAATQQMIEAAAAALGSAAARHGDTPEQQARYGEAATYAAGAAGGVAVLAARTRGGAHIAAQLEGKAAAGVTHGFRSDIFTRTTTWTAPVGTRQTYKVYQRSDINWAHLRTSGPGDFIGKTNGEAARAGHAPQLANGYFATLHHIGQNNKGPLVEASTRYHGVGRPGQDIIHGQFGRRQPHPTNPVEHDIWAREKKVYWKIREGER